MTDITWMQTFTGKAFSFETIDPSKITLDDIAWSLSRLPRFNGHGIGLTVLQHSLGVADLVQPAAYEMSRQNKADRLAALLHDASEAYIGDLIRPLKNAVPALMQLEKRIDMAIIERFDVKFYGDVLDRIEHADDVMLYSEAQHFFPNPCEMEWIDQSKVLPMAQLEKLKDKTWIHFIGAVSQCLTEKAARELRV